MAPTWTKTVEVCKENNFLNKVGRDELLDETLHIVILFIIYIGMGKKETF